MSLLFHQSCFFYIAICIFIICLDPQSVVADDQTNPEEVSPHVEYLTILDELEQERMKIRSGSFSTEGRFSGFTKETFAAGTIKLSGYFDYEKNLERFDRVQPRWAKVDQKPEMTDLSVLKSSCIFAPKWTIFFHNGVGGVNTAPELVIREPETESHTSGHGRFDVRSLGLQTSYFEFIRSKGFDRQIRYYRGWKPKPDRITHHENGTISIEKDRKAGPPYKEIDSLLKIVIDQKNGFTPVKLIQQVYVTLKDKTSKPRESKNKPFLYEEFETNLTWTKQAGTYVPRTLSLRKREFTPKKDTREETKLNLTFTWHSINEPIPEERFDYHDVKLDRSVIVVVQTGKKRKLVEELRPDGTRIPF